MPTPWSDLAAQGGRLRVIRDSTIIQLQLVTQPDIQGQRDGGREGWMDERMERGGEGGTDGRTEKGREGGMDGRREGRREGKKAY